MKPCSYLRFRAKQSQTNFEINSANAEAVVEICTRMDGIPLALELAAASLHHMSLVELVDILRPENQNQWLEYIGEPARDLPIRQQTLENVIAWSYSLLSPEKQELFRRLGVFTDLFDAEAVSAICIGNGMDKKTSKLELEYLAAHSLLQQNEINGHTYWKMLEIIHEFSNSRIMEDERKKLQAAHAEFYKAMLEKALRNSSGLDFESFFQLNGGNLRQALIWAVSTRHPKMAVPLAKDLCDLWEHVGYLRQGMELIQQVVEMPGKVEDTPLIVLLNRLSTLSWQQHHFDYALSIADRAVSIARTNSLDDAYPLLLNLKGRIFIEQGSYDEAHQVLSESYTLAQAHPEMLNPGAPGVQLGEVELAIGNYAMARTLLEKGLSHLNDGDSIYYPMVLTDLAEVALATQDYEEAFRNLKLASQVAGQHIRRQLYFLSTLAGYLVMKSEEDPLMLKQAVERYAAITSLLQSSGEVLVPFYFQLNNSRIALARKKLSKREWEIAWESGLAWSKRETYPRAISGLFQ